MGLVRCEKHDLLFNDKNPRGCLACEQERLGRKSDISMMQSLARASRSSQHAPTFDQAGKDGPTLGDRLTVLRLYFPAVDSARIVPIGSALIVLLFAVWYFTSRARFVDQIHPLAVESSGIRPLSVRPGHEVTTLFAILGTQPPTPHPDDRRVARYSYGTGLFVDAINGFVYSINLGVGSRSWQGMRVGMAEREARGAMALLGAVEQSGRTRAVPQIEGSFNVFPSIEDKPVKQLLTEVRPPNGCYDVIAELQPRSLGVLIAGERRLAVISRSSNPMDPDDLEWFVSQIRVVNRQVAGPDGSRIC